MIIYLIISGFLTPSFMSFSYFFTMDVLGISKFTYSMMTVMSNISILIGSKLYRRYLKHKEYRNLFLGESVIKILMAPLTFMLVLRKNVEWGIPDLPLVILTENMN